MWTMHDAPSDRDYLEQFADDRNSEDEPEPEDPAGNVSEGFDDADCCPF